MMRLIDANKVLEFMTNKLEMQDLYLPIHLKELVIDEMPTAYDLEKVIDQLEIKILANAVVGNRAAEDTVRECLNIVRGEQE